MNSLISPDDHWIIWTSLISVAALSLYLEQNYKLFQKITGALVAMVGGMILSNTGFLPTESSSYDIVWDYVIPLTIPLLLMKTDIRRIVRETGRMFGAFHISALGTIIGSIVAVIVLHSSVPFLELIVPAMTGSYIGGSINFVALVSIFEPPKDLVNATIVADNGVMALYFLVLITLPSLAIMRRIFPMTERAQTFYDHNPKQGESYWSPKAISLLDIASVLAIAFVIATISVKVSSYFADPAFHVEVYPANDALYFLSHALPKLCQETQWIGRNRRPLHLHLLHAHWHPGQHQDGDYGSAHHDPLLRDHPGRQWHHHVYSREALPV